MSTVGRRRQEKPITTRKLGDIAGVCDHCVTGMGVAVEAEGFEIEGSGHAPDTASQIVKERVPGTSSFCRLPIMPRNPLWPELLCADKANI